MTDMVKKYNESILILCVCVDVCKYNKYTVYWE